jgi:arabinofuranosyltransferase
VNQRCAPCILGPHRAGPEESLRPQATENRGGSLLTSRATLSRLVVLLAVVHAGLFFTHAWVVDDAYITFRVVDNFVSGLGLRWNPDERVQAYTHPLWLFLVSGAYFFSREAFFTSLALSFVTSAAALVVVVRALDTHRSAWSKLVFLGVLLASKAFLDYSSSGLENPLTHLLLALFFTRFLLAPRPWSEASPREVTVLFLLAALGFVNRQDTALFFFPACTVVLIEQIRSRGPRALKSVLLGVAPAPVWLLFSCFYYGSFVPNTAYAKLTGPRISRIEQLRAGGAYFVDSVFLDPATLALCLAAVVVALLRRQRRAVCAALGIVAYLGYVAAAGAVGTHMSGRFFSGAAFLAALVLAAQLGRLRQSAPVFALTALVLVAAPHSPLRVGTKSYPSESLWPRNDLVIDTREFARREGAALLNFGSGVKRPNHAALKAGQRFRDAPERVHLGGPGGFPLMVGYSGYAAGPDKHIVDILGLTDPLIARLPIPEGGAWRPGHFFRNLPPGYLESIEQRKNLVEDANLRSYYDVIRLVTRGPLLSGKRAIAAWGLATAQYDQRLRLYAMAHGLRWR